MADKLRPDELQAFKAAFDMFDKNGDGTISTKVSLTFGNNNNNLIFQNVLT
jgi:Ca2+-binding EF-hand superfamily protein